MDTNFTTSASRQTDSTAMSTKQTSSEVTFHKGQEFRDWLGDTFQRMYTVDSGASSNMMGFSSLSHKVKKTIRQTSTNSGYSDSQWRCGLRHASKGLHQGAWRLSMGTFGGIFTVSAIVGKTMQSAWLFLFVADRRNSQIVKRQESDRMLHRKLRPVVAVTKPKDVPSIEFSSASKRSGGHHVGSLEAIYRRIKKIRCIVPQLQELDVDEEKPLHEKLPSVATDALERYSGKIYLE